MERVAEYYYVTGDAKAKAILDKWVAWALENTTINADGTFHIPSDLTLDRRAGHLEPVGTRGNNTGLHVTVDSTTPDIGVAGSLRQDARPTTRAKSGDAAAKTCAKELLDGIWANEPGRQGRLGAGDPQGLRPVQRQGLRPRRAGPARCRTVTRSTRARRSCRSAVLLQEGPGLAARSRPTSTAEPAPTFTYHRFWAQADVATAFAVYAEVIG